MNSTEGRERGAREGPPAAGKTGEGSSSAMKEMVKRAALQPDSPRIAGVGSDAARDPAQDRADTSSGLPGSKK